MAEQLSDLKAAYDAAAERWDTAAVRSSVWEAAAMECASIRAKAQALTGMTKPFLRLALTKPPAAPSPRARD